MHIFFSAFRFAALALPAALTLGAPASAQLAPVVSPALPTPPPTIPASTIVPPLSATQAVFLAAWLDQGMEQGLSKNAGKAAQIAGKDALIRSVLDRALALHNGRVDTADFLEVWALRPAPYDPLPAFAQAVASDRLAQWVAGLTPPYSGYEGLRKGLAAYRDIRARGGWPTVSAQSSPAAVRARLSIEDKSGAATETIAAAIQRAQRRYGLNPTGLLDAATVAALNVPVDDRIDAIRANMERWRWVPRALPVNRVQVNIAAAVLTVFEGDAPVASMRAVTGRPGNETPMMESKIHSIVVNPPWNVPSSIAKKELWPKGRAALLRQGYKIVGTPETGERIVQPAGPRSALGRLKFDFQNPFAVYLHDTPSRAKFSSYDRLASHGCVRLEKPVPLAELMVRDDPQFAGKIQAAIDTGKTQRISLTKQQSVYLLYWTAFSSASGTMNFRSDPYGWDSLLAAKLEASSQRADTIATKE